MSTAPLTLPLRPAPQVTWLTPRRPWYYGLGWRVVRWLEQHEAQLTALALELLTISVLWQVVLNAQGMR